MEPNKIILAIFAITYIGIAIGHIPGLKLNRVGIALLGAIGMMIFGGISTADAISYINGPTICLLFGFFVISAQLRNFVGRFHICYLVSDIHVHNLNFIQSEQPDVFRKLAANCLFYGERKDIGSSFYLNRYGNGFTH